jgi:hypothetical protein
MIICFFPKQAILMRRSTILILPLQLVTRGVCEQALMQCREKTVIKLNQLLLQDNVIIEASKIQSSLCLVIGTKSIYKYIQIYTYIHIHIQYIYKSS